MKRKTETKPDVELRGDTELSRCHFSIKYEKSFFIKDMGMN
jgi:hypothetical protein